MGVFTRLSDIINSNINALLDRAEDPEKIIRLIIQEMEDTLVEIRSSAVKTIAEKKELERKLATLRREHDEWSRRAELAVEKGRDDLARGAILTRKKFAQEVETLTEQLRQIDEALGRQHEDVRALQAKLEDAKAREQAIVARHTTAANRLKIRQKVYDDRLTGALARFEQAERSLEQLESRVEAQDMGRTRTLADELAELEAQSGVDQELAEIRQRVAGRGATVVPLGTLPAKE